MVITASSDNKLTKVTKSNVSAKQQDVIDNLIKLAQLEKEKGNTSVTQEKLVKLQSYLDGKKDKFNYNTLPVAPKPKYPPLYERFKLAKPQVEEKTPHTRIRSPYRKFLLKRLERIIVEVLEVLANILDNLHLFSKFPMFPQKLVRLLKQTNKIWIVILIFLIKKTITQLLNVRKKERKVKMELEIVKSTSTKGVSSLNQDIVTKYKKVLKDLRFDKMMLYIELVGNFLDMSFNLIEFTEWAVPDWFMSILNASSMFMTIYRMNKDDEYIDDDITEDLI